MNKTVGKFQLVGEKVILRPVEISDYLDIYKNIQDKKIALYVGTPYPYTQLHAKQFIEGAIKNWKENMERQFAIIEKSTGKFAGMIGLMFKKHDGPVGEVGFWLGDEFRGKGLMPEATKLLIGYGFEKEGLKKIYGRAYAPNKASCRVFEKLGFKLEGRLRKQTYRMGVVFDTNFYGLLKEEFKG